MAKVLVGIPSAHPSQGFLESLPSFLNSASANHKFNTHWVMGKGRAEARNEIVDVFMSGDFTHLLFLDDDHTGHTTEMLEALFAPQTHVCAIKCYSRYFPFYSTLMDYSGDPDKRFRYVTTDLSRGYKGCELVGFGMTLIRRDTFDIISKPYFVAEDNMREDNYFCDKLLSAGIKPIGCFEYVLPHNGIDDSNVAKLRHSEAPKFARKVNNERILKKIQRNKEIENADLHKSDNCFIVSTV